MNKALLMVAASGLMSVVAAGAWAQPAPPAPEAPRHAQPGAPPPPGPGPQARGPMPPPPGFPPGARMPDGMPGPHGMAGPHGWHHGPPPPPSRAAMFHIERGDISIGIRCAEDEPTRACVDAAIALMDKANTLTAP